MINNVRIRTRQRKRELVNTNIEIHLKHYDTSFIETYKDTSDDYTKRIYTFVILYLDIEIILLVLLILI